MTLSDWAVMAVGPFCGWVLYVERRLSKLDSIKEKVDLTENRVLKIYDHLIGQEQRKDG